MNEDHVEFEGLRELKGSYKCPVCSTRNYRTFLWWETPEEVLPKSTLSHWCSKCGAVHKISYYVENNKEGFKIKILLFECNSEITKYKRFKIERNSDG